MKEKFGQVLKLLKEKKIIVRSILILLLFGLTLLTYFSAGKLMSKVLGISTGYLIAYDGEPGSAPLSSTNFTHAETLDGFGLNNGHGIRLKPDRWNAALVSFRDSPAWRSDLGAYDVVQFDFRTIATDPQNLTITFGKYVSGGVGGTSKTVKIQDYVVGGVLDSTFRKVNIPVSALVASNWNLAGVETVKFNTDPNSAYSYIDNIVFKDATGPTVSGVFAETDNVLRITVDERFNLGSARNLSNFSLNSTADANYSVAKNPISSGASSRFKTYTALNTVSSAISDHYIYIQFKNRLVNGTAYNLTVNNITDNTGNPSAAVTLTFTYSDDKVVDSIKVNQEGYLPNVPKNAYIGGYFGDLGGGSWAVTSSGKIYFKNNNVNWVEQTTPITTPLNGIYGFREDDVWAVGDAGVILHFDGNTWVKVTSPVTNNLNSVYFDEKNIGWIVGDSGKILKYDNSTWQSVASPTTVNLNKIAYGAIAGDSGNIFKYNGTSWVLAGKIDNFNLNAISGRRQFGWNLIVGDNGQVIKNNYGTPVKATIAGGVTTNLTGTAINPNGNDIRVVGDGGLIWKVASDGSVKSTITSGTANNLKSIAFETVRQWWTGGVGGLIYGVKMDNAISSQTVATATINEIFTLPAGTMRLDKTTPQAQLIDVNNSSIVYTMTPSMRSSNYFMTGEDVYMLDFSSFKTPGTYKIHVPGLGNSYDFKIGPDAYDDVVYHTGRYLYYARANFPITTPYADPQFTRGASHQYNDTIKIDGAFHPSLVNTPLYNGEVICPLNTSPCPAGSYKDMSGGWFDAGDYSKYIPTAAPSVFDMLSGYEMSPVSFGDNLNIPESGNNIPDILDEAKWEIEWMLKMQDTDGGVYFKLASQMWETGTPDKSNLGGQSVRFAMEKTTLTTAEAAAVFAQASRVYKNFDVNFSNKLLTAAKLGWNFLKVHPTMLPVGGYKDPAGHISGSYPDAGETDERGWLAAELYRTTGSTEYKTYFETNGYTGNGCFGYHGNEWQDSSPACLWAYINTAKDGRAVDAVILKKAKDSLISSANTNLDRQQSGAYMMSARVDVPVYVGWGTIGFNTREATQLLRAWYITGDQKYVDGAFRDTTTTLGGNPLSQSFITGLGDKKVMMPLQGQSVWDNVIDPIPGYNVFGVTSHMSNSNGYYAGSQADTNNYPETNNIEDPLPLLRRWADHHYLVQMNESTIQPIAMNFAVFPILVTLGGGATACTPNCSSASTICTGLTIGDGCGGTCLGTKLSSWSVWSAWNENLCQIDNTKSRARTDVNSCASGQTEVAACTICVENWSCNAWSQCGNNSQSRICTDLNTCGTIVNKPNNLQGCTDTCTPNWVCNTWSTCSSSAKTRSCVDSNNCNIATGKPVETSECTNPPALDETEAEIDEIIPVPVSDLIKIRRDFYKGRLIKVTNDSAVYHVASDGKRRLFVNSPTFWSWRTGTWTDHLVETISQAEFDVIPLAKNVTVRPGSKLIKFKGSEVIYTVKVGDIICPATFGYGDNWMARLIIIQNSFESDYTRDNDCSISSDNLLYPDGSLIQYKNSTDIWYIDNNTKRQVLSSVFRNNNFKDSDVVKEVSDDVIYKTGDPLESWD